MPLARFWMMQRSWLLSSGPCSRSFPGREIGAQEMTRRFAEFNARLIFSQRLLLSARSHHKGLRRWALSSTVRGSAAQIACCHLLLPVQRVFLRTPVRLTGDHRHTLEHQGRPQHSDICIPNEVVYVASRPENPAVKLSEASSPQANQRWKGDGNVCKGASVCPLIEVLYDGLV
mmetsp:Transcript_137158/g.249361  ORF Transcript_137158/g.249361 Transcript_137158/m.249361 type:complete len:174 (+) Transcript_137158:425-946(+)